MSRHHAALFEGVILGGFECSTHRLADGRRLDMVGATRHDRFASADYARLRDAAMTACREGVSWVAAEVSPNCFDFASAQSRLRAADRHGVQVIWDLMHFGWPDDVDIFAPSFPTRFGRYAKAFARHLSNESGALPMFAPINEMSFLAWGGGDVRCLNPFEAARGVELKAQLVCATIEAIEAIRDVLPHARFLQPEPVIHIVPDPALPKTWARVASDELLQYQAWDMLAGRVWPTLGGHPKYLDILGVNFYSGNQFMIDGTCVERGDGRYKPFREMLLEVWSRYGRPMIVSETGSEGEARAPWLEYVGGECVAALGEGCELHGVTLYPIVDHPGWLDGRHCENGLWGYADDDGRRAVHAPLLTETERQSLRLHEAREEMLRGRAAGAPQALASVL